MFLIITLYAVLAATFVFAKYAVACAAPSFLIGFRMVLAGLCLLGYQAVRNKKALSIKTEDYWLFARTALFHIYLAFTFEFWALQYVGAFKTNMIYATTPFIAASLAYILHKERLNIAKKIGILIGVAGLVPIFLTAQESSLDVASLWVVGLPEVVLFSSACFSAYAWFLVKDLMQRGYALVVINGISMLGGGVLSLITSLIVYGPTIPVTNWHMFLLWVGLLILSANIIVYNLYGTLLRRYSITLLTFAGFLCPSFGALYEWLLTGKCVSWHYFVSLALVMTGLYVFYRQELSKDRLIN
jgi:drug/metabolite transporter (DMT)-like permease